MSEGTSRGKPARLLRSGWTDAWEDPANPKPLPMPLQFLLSAQALERIEQDAVRGGAGGKTLLTYYVGQVVGTLNEVRPAAEVMRQMNKEADAVLKQMSQLLTRADASDRAT